MMKRLLLLPIKFCTRCLYKLFDLLISAMQMSAQNWMKIGRRAADAGLDTAGAAQTHAKELQQRVGHSKPRE